MRNIQGKKGKFVNFVMPEYSLSVVFGNKFSPEAFILRLCPCRIIRPGRFARIVCNEDVGLLSDGSYLFFNAPRMQYFESCGQWIVTVALLEPGATCI